MKLSIQQSVWRGLIYLCMSACLGACGGEWQREPVDLIATAPAVTPPSYLRLHKEVEHPRLKRRVSANFSPQEVSLQKAIVSVLPFPVSLMSADEHVDLNRAVAVRVEDVSVGDYLRQLEGITGYHIQPNDDLSVIRVASLVTRSWNLAALADTGDFKARLGFDASAEDGAASALGGGSSNSFRSSHDMSIQRGQNTHTWDAMLRQSHCILNTASCGGASPASVSVDANGAAPNVSRGEAWLVDNRRLGLVTATGNPQKIERLDRWLRELMSESSRLIHLECAILDVSTDNIEQLGLHLDALFERGDFNLQLTRGNNDPADDGLLVGVGLDSDRFNLSALIDNLSSVGDVRIHSRVQFSVTNGATAYLNTGEVFSYISNTDTLTTETGTTRGFQQSRLQVGLQLAITPRFLNSGDKLLLEVTPILSSLLRFDELSSDGGDISAPVIALRQLTSQATTSSGRPIAIGGLEWHKSTHRESGFFTPVGLSGKLLTNRKNERESRQLLIIVTPWEVT